MADEQQEEQAAKPKGKGKLIIIIVLVVLLLLGGAGAFLMMSGNEAPAEEVAVEEVSGQEDESSDSVEATYVGMPRPFLFNLDDAKRIRLVEIKVQLMVRNADDELLAKKHIPLIEDNLLTTFSAAEITKLKTQTGKDDLRQKALINVQNALKPVAGKDVVEKVLFTGFVMQ